MIRLQHILLSVTFVALFLTACDSQPQAQEVPTATLVSVGRLTPDSTATQVPTRTPPPTFTFTPSITPIPPSPTESLTPTPTPPVIGIVNSPFEAINVREGPGTNFNVVTSIAPGTGVQIIGQDQPDESREWFLILMEDGRQGWVASNLVRLESTVTPVPSATPSPDLTAIAAGSPLPTAVLGGGTITPTPPGAVISTTPVTATPRAATTAVTGTAAPPLVPVINFDSINQTATALAGGLASPTPRPTNTSTLTVGSPPGTTITPLPGTGQTPFTPSAVVTSTGAGIVQEGVQILAVCDDRSQGFPAPTNLGAGSTIRIWWSWFALTRQQVEDHLAAAIYEVRLDGILLPNISQYRTPIQQRTSDYAVSWFVPAGPLAAGAHQITYRVTWSATISDGIDNFGPGTNRLVEEGSCVFTVN